MEPCARRPNKLQDMPKCKCKSLKNDNAKLQRDLNEAIKENNVLRCIVNKNESECSKIHKLKQQVKVLSSRVKNVRSPQKRSASLESINQKRSTSLDTTIVSENLDVTQVVYESLSKKKNIAELKEKYNNIKQGETFLRSELRHEKRNSDQAKKQIQNLQCSMKSLKDRLRSANEWCTQQLEFFKKEIDQLKLDCCELRKTSIEQLEVFRSALSDIHVQTIEKVQSMAIEGYKAMQFRGKEYEIQHVHGEQTGSHNRHGKQDNCNSLTSNLYTYPIQELQKPAECKLGVSSILESDYLRAKYKELEERLRQGRQRLKEDSIVCNAKPVNSSTNTDLSYGFNEQQLIQSEQCFEIKPDIMKLETKIDTPKVIRDTSENIVNTNLSEIILAKDELILSLEKRVKDLNGRCETLITKLKQNEETLKYFNLQKESFDETKEHIHKRVQDFIAVQETNTRLKSRIHNLESDNERLERLLLIQQSTTSSKLTNQKQSETLLKESDAQIYRLQEQVDLLSAERDKLKKGVSTYKLQKGSHIEKLECEIETLKDKIRTLTCVIDNYKSEKHLRVKENKELHKRLSDIENNATTLLEKENDLKKNREERASLTRECRQKSEYIAQLQDCLRKATKQISELKNNRENETETLCRLNDDLKKAKIVEQQLQEKDRDLRQEKGKLLELTRKLENCESKNNNINRLYTESQTREETLQKELKKDKASLKAAESSLEEIARKYEISEHEKSELIIENQTLYDNLKRTQLDDDACKDKNEQENRRMAEKLSNSETQYRDLEKRLGVLSEEKYELERKLSSFELQKESVEKRQHEIEILKTEQQAHLKNIESLKNDKCQIEKQIVELLECPNSAVCTNSVLDNLRKRLVENQELQSSLAHECETKRTKLGQLEEQLQLASNKILEFQESKNAQSETICRLNDDLKKAKIVEHQLNEKDRDHRQEKRKLLELTRKLERCESKNNNINRLYTESQTREETLQKELENAKASLKAADCTSEEIARKYEISEHEKSELIIENQTLYDSLKRTQLDDDACKEKNEQENRHLAKKLLNSETQYRDLEKRLGVLSEEKYELERKLSSLELLKEDVKKRQHETQILKTEQKALLLKIESLKNDKCQIEKQVVELLECPNSAVCTNSVLDNLRKRLVENQELQSSLAHECATNKTKLGQLEEQLQLASNKILDFQESQTAQSETICRLNDDLRKAKIVEQQLNEKDRDLQQDKRKLHELTRRLERCESKNNNINRLYTESQTREETLQKELENAKASFKAADRSLREIARKYEISEHEKSELIIENQTLYDNLKRTQLDNDACKDKTDQENRRLAKQLSNSETKYRDLEKRLGFLSEEKYELERKLSALELQKESVEKRQHEIEILKTEQQALLKKIESLKNEKCQIEKQIVELLQCPNSAVCTNSVLDNLRKRLVENQELQCSLAHECESNKTKLGHFEQQLQLRVHEILALNERNKIQTDTISRLNEDLQTAKIVEQQLNNKCRDLLQDKNNLHEQSKSFGTLAKQLENSENENANVNQLYKESKKREKELIKTLETTEAMLVEVQEQANKISQKYDTSEKQNTQLLNEIKDCHVQLKSAQQNLIEAEKSFNSKLKSELDRNEAEKLKQREKYKKKIFELNKEIERAKKANFDDDHGAQDKLARANKDLAETRRELEETKTRLSKLMGQKLTNNNPNIADLSDQNRPTKLAERYTELYDNQWTDAFEVIDQGNEQATIDLLMQILYDCFTFCEKESMRQLDNLRSVLMLHKGQVVVSEILNKQLKDCRKAVAIESGQHLLETYMADLQQNGSDLSKVAKKVPSYVKECFSVCWLMSIQDPSLVLGNSDQVRPGAAFNSEQYKAYTESGPVVEFLVWPAMFLYKDGPLLCKGVAQGRRSSRKH